MPIQLPNLGVLYSEPVQRALESTGKIAARTAKPVQVLLAGVTFGAVAYAFIAIIPIYLKAYEFRNAVYNETQLAVTNMASSGDIQSVLVEKALALGLPVEKSDIQAESSANAAPIGTVTSIVNDAAPTHETADVDIQVSYAVPVKIPFHTFYLKFRVHEKDDSGTIDR